MSTTVNHSGGVARGEKVVEITHQVQQPFYLDQVEDIETLPEGLFPDWCEKMINEVSDATETPRELATSFLLAVLAAATQKKWKVHVEGSHYEPLSLWMVCALPPANRKSSVKKFMTKPLELWQMHQTTMMKDLIEGVKSERKAIFAGIERLEKAAAKAENREERQEYLNKIRDLREDLPDDQEFPLVLIQDITPEHLGTMLGLHDERLSLFSDEGGVFDTLAGRYSNGIPNLDIFLQSHDGGSVRVDRGSREPVSLREPALSFGLSPQPDVLRCLTSNKGFEGRGLLARFLYLLPRSKVGSRLLEAKTVSHTTEAGWKDGVFSLLNYPQPLDEESKLDPLLLKFSKEAHKAYKTFQRGIEKDLGEFGKFEHIQGWAGKIAGQAARIAGLIHCAEYADAHPHNKDIEGPSINKAIAIVNILIEHALSAFDLMGVNGDIEDARKIWRWIESRQREEFTRSDCQQQLKVVFKRIADIQPGLDVLEERYLILNDTEKTRKAGRPVVKYRVNPVAVQRWEG
ncbi:MAG: DUF3987 domain-containing protein [Gammaproteobacteria bacterium]|jgi:hypothetical protein|nr:DUF3987 domain-containing protein [Gammaproteobacteria bacterium]MBT4300442.1 DUF3987 domain-containing protein [Gammaproteobacteria bacterium]MBT5687652.1 DUF3987 domain-containing protein [Gammaproteobacteria bacterium]MBT6479008.1 DUF3987 domain-containing protein [Gammaproteobacteria bacterium]MBT7479450.1 DUF3987 domain-containing protein [Gammaproteobacteria bacterium]